jgi:hypothetical protein
MKCKFIRVYILIKIFEIRIKWLALLISFGIKPRNELSNLSQDINNLYIKVQKSQQKKTRNK